MNNIAKTICVVEDDEGIREMIEYILGSKQFRIISCPTVQSFRDQIRKVLPDLVILDIMLPDGNGADLGKEIIDNKLTNHIPILFMSANLKFTLPAEFTRQDFIRKPFDIGELLLKIDKLLNRNTTPA